MPDGTIFYTQNVSGLSTGNTKTAIIASVDDGQTWKIVGYYTTRNDGMCHPHHIFPWSGKLVISSRVGAGKCEQTTDVITVSGTFGEGDTPKIIHPVYWVSPGGRDLTNTDLWGMATSYGWSPSTPWATLAYALGGDQVPYYTVQPPPLDRDDSHSRVVNGSRIICSLESVQVDTTTGLKPYANNRLFSSGNTGPIYIEGTNQNKPLKIYLPNAGTINKAVNIWDTADHPEQYTANGLGFINCELWTEKSGAGQALIYTYDSSASSYPPELYFENCIIGNRAFSPEQLFQCRGNLVTFKNCLVQTGPTGAIDNSYTGQTSAQNTVFRGGTSQIKHFGVSASKFYNCVFYDYAYYGIRMPFTYDPIQTPPTIKNCIFYSSQVGAKSISNNNDIMVTDSYVDYNCFGQADSTTNLTNNGGTHSIQQDPKFFDPAHGNFHLDMTSPCVDSGTSDDTPVMDSDGNTRYDIPAVPNTGGGYFPYYDMGAFEFLPIPPHSIYGRVTGTVQADVTINLYKVLCGYNSLVEITKTNAAGSYLFTNLDGIYSIEAVYSGCNFNPPDYANVSPDDNVSHDFSLECP
jgi:hypothetical protein